MSKFPLSLPIDVINMSVEDKELETYLKECKKKSNDERWSNLEKEIFLMKKTLQRHGLAINIKE